MPIFVQYTTSHSIGRFRVAATRLDAAITETSSALRGLQCTKATLRLSNAAAGFSEGLLIATYTPAKGWMIRETIRAYAKRCRTGRLQAAAPPTG